MLVFPMLLVITSAQQIPASVPPPEEAARKIADCGFRARDVRAQFDSVLQEEVIRVRTATAVARRRLECVARASLAISYYVEFDREVQKRYEPIYWALEKQASLAMAKAWLGERGLLDKLPRYDARNDSLVSIWRRLKDVCGIPQDSAFVEERGILTPNLAALQTREIGDDAFRCLLNAAVVTNAPVGFIGNEAPLRLAK